MNQLSRRAFLSRQAGGLGQIALGSLLLGGTGMAKGAQGKSLGLEGLPHFAPTAKRVIYLFQSGGPSHCDLFDYSPAIDKLQGTELPPSVRGDQRVTGMTSSQGSYPVVAPMWNMSRCGERGTWISDLLPYTQKIADKIAIVRSVHTEAINHDPAVTFINTGSQQPGNASMGAWLSYGLGSENENLPAYTVLMSQGSGKNPGQPLFSRLWGSGFLPSNHQGVNLRPGANPVLYLANPKGITSESRRAMLDQLAQLNDLQAQETGDPEIPARVAAYEMAFRMQTSVPSLTDLSDESDSTFDLYGPESRRPGSFAANCLLARRMAERGVRFIQLFHRGWDQHIAIKQQLPKQCRDTDQPSAALIVDLHERGLLDDTLVIWGGEFGRTVYSQGALGSPQAGRDHHGRCFSVWMAGGGVKRGCDYGQTDDFCYNITENPVHINDLNATILHCLGINHDRFTFPFRGLDQRLTGVEESHVVHGVLG
ncbi:MAG: DUF1501 domain-containing protein [Planctomycetes bacterium]|nr:DUF1501 domain-containing protein [Planctomycetota bacterium]